MKSVLNAVNEAAYRTVHDYPGGGIKLANRMGLQPRVLLNKVNPDQRHNKLSLEESVTLQRITGDARILHEIARLLGYIVIKIENPSSPSDTELLTLYCRWNAETGDIHRAIADAFDAPTLTPQHQTTIEKQFHAATTAGFVCVQRMGGLVQ
ncbi:MAG TPA: phage regulatory CII family protein [Candidatus Competibacteraceae bacterium]|nr:phage regulatory CII family protein [Candidatus Competibacteraceae bacterium]